MLRCIGVLKKGWVVELQQVLIVMGKGVSYEI